MLLCGSLDIHVVLNNKRAKVKAVRLVSQRLLEKQAGRVKGQLANDSVYLYIFSKCFCCLIKTMTAEFEYSEQHTALIKYYGRLARTRAEESHYNT